MKVFIILAVIGAAFGAPTENTEDIQRWKEPVTLFLAPAENGRRLREVQGEHHEEHMQRSYYDLPAAVSPGISAAAAAAAINAAASGAGVASSGGSALGIFPGAKLGGCAIPLLLSCAPSVHSGHLAQPSYAAPAYRTDVDHKMRASDAQWQRSEVSQFTPVELQSMDGQAREMEWMQGSERAMQNEMKNEMNPHHHHHHLVALDIHPNNHH